MSYDTDVIVIGSGGGGAVIAKELGEMGIRVWMMEAGSWYGNRKWPKPNEEHGAFYSSDPADHDALLYRHQLNKLENNMNDPITGRFRWGPADRGRSPWLRVLQQNGTFWQAAGVGGSTLHYLGNSPRAFPAAIQQGWPLPYRELIPYYEKVEQTLPVHFAPTTSKEELFYYGARRAGWPLIATLDVTSPGYRPQPNAILMPNENLMNPSYSLEQLSFMEGCTLAGHCINGCPHGPSIERMAKRSTNVSYVPLALKTGYVTIRPNAFVTNIMTDIGPDGRKRAIGVRYRDTWTLEWGELTARAVVMAAGAVETPRLWLNSDLPENPWVGKGLTNHYMDWITGIFDEKDVWPILGRPTIDQFMGPNSGARLDVPGLGSLQVTGLGPGLEAVQSFALSQSGFSFLNQTEPEAPWDMRGRPVGPQLKELMANYRLILSILLLTDDEVDQRNGVSTDPLMRDEHGPVPAIHYIPTPETVRRRNKLAKIAADILRQAGAKTVIRIDWPAGVFIHIESTMRMGFVTDSSCEAYQVARLYIADNSVHYNSIGGANPTLTTQALAVRTAEKLAEKYFS